MNKIGFVFNSIGIFAHGYTQYLFSQDTEKTIKNIVDKLAKINIFYVKIFQGISTNSNLLPISLVEYLTKFTDHCPYIEDDIDIEDVIDFIDIIKPKPKPPKEPIEDIIPIAMPGSGPIVTPSQSEDNEEINRPLSLSCCKKCDNGMYTNRCFPFDSDEDDDCRFPTLEICEDESDPKLPSMLDIFA